MARHYRLVFRGKYLPGFVPDDVHSSVATLLNAPVDKVQALLSGIPAVIKRDVEVEQGNRYLEALAEIGLMTHLELLTDETGEPIKPGSWDGLERRSDATRRHRADRRAGRRGAAIVPERRQTRGRRKTDVN